MDGPGGQRLPRQVEIATVEVGERVTGDIERCPEGTDSEPAECQSRSRCSFHQRRSSDTLGIRISNQARTSKELQTTKARAFRAPEPRKAKIARAGSPRRLGNANTSATTATTCRTDARFSQEKASPNDSVPTSAEVVDQPRASETEAPARHRRKLPPAVIVPPDRAGPLGIKPINRGAATQAISSTRPPASSPVLHASARRKDSSLPARRSARSQPILPSATRITRISNQSPRHSNPPDHARKTRSRAA